MTGTNLPVMSIQEWRQLLNDTQALLLAPKKHHRSFYITHMRYVIRTLWTQRPWPICWSSRTKH